MVLDESAPFTDDVLKLGHYLRPSIDICPAMIAKILMKIGQVLDRSTYRPLIPDEFLDKDGSDAQEQFMAKVYKWLWLQVLHRESEDIGQGNTPHYDPYKYETKNEQTFLQLAGARAHARGGISL